MTAKIIDGKAIAEQNLNKLKKEIIERENEGIRPPCLAVILVGDDPASSIYVNKKNRRAQTSELNQSLISCLLIQLNLI